MAPDWERVNQTGWTGLIASMMRMFSSTTAERALELGKMAAFIETAAIARARKPRSRQPRPDANYCLPFWRQVIERWTLLTAVECPDLQLTW